MKVVTVDFEVWEWNLMGKELHNNKDHKLHSSMTNQLDETYKDLGLLPTVILQKIDQYSHDLIVIWNENMKLIYSSRSLRELLNYSRLDVNGDAWRDKVSIEDALCIDSSMKKDTPIQLLNVKILNNVGEDQVFEIKIERHLEKEKNQMVLIGFCKHVPQTFKSEEMSITNQLIAGIAHEIRNPLTSIKGFLQLLKAGVSDRDPYLQIMSEEIDKIEAITSELLFVSKPLTDKKQVKSVQSMVQDIIILLNSQAKLKNISVHNNVKHDFFVLCDGSKIKQALINIIKNAIEATEPSGKIDVLTYKTGDSVKIDVIDQGPGILKSDIDKITEPFYTTKLEGTGLGLMITKQIIEKHHGTLKVIKNKDKGSTFSIILPEHKKNDLNNLKTVYK